MLLFFAIVSAFSPVIIPKTGGSTQWEEKQTLCNRLRKLVVGHDRDVRFQVDHETLGERNLPEADQPVHAAARCGEIGRDGLGDRGGLAVLGELQVVRQAVPVGAEDGQLVETARHVAIDERFGAGEVDRLHARIVGDVVRGQLDRLEADLVEEGREDALLLDVGDEGLEGRDELVGRLAVVCRPIEDVGSAVRVGDHRIVDVVRELGVLAGLHVFADGEGHAVLRRLVEGGKVRIVEGEAAPLANARRGVRRDGVQPVRADALLRHDFDEEPGE